MKKYPAVFKLSQDPQFLPLLVIGTEQQPKFIVDEQNNRTCITSTSSSIHLPSFMSKDQTVLKYHRIQILRMDGHTDTRTEGKPKVPSGDTPVGD